MNDRILLFTLLALCVSAAGASQPVAAALAVELDLANREYFVQHAAKLKARLDQESTKKSQ